MAITFRTIAPRRSTPRQSSTSEQWEVVIERLLEATESGSAGAILVATRAGEFALFYEAKLNLTKTKPA